MISCLIIMDSLRAAFKRSPKKYIEKTDAFTPLKTSTSVGKIGPQTRSSTRITPTGTQYTEIEKKSTIITGNIHDIGAMETTPSLLMLVEDILNSNEQEPINKSLQEVTGCLNEILQNVSNSSRELERKKAELACERLQLISALRTLRQNRRLEKAIKKERMDSHAETKQLLEAEITEIEQALESHEPDSENLKRYSQISTFAEAKTLYENTLTKLELFEKLKNVLRNKMSVMEEDDKKKSDQSSTRTTPRNDLTSRRTLKVALRRRRHNQHLATQQTLL